MNNRILLLALMLFLMIQVNAQFRWEYISPVPGSKYINPENNIAFRHGGEILATSLKQLLIDVEGSVSGRISGKTNLSKDSRTLLFYPDKPFKDSEKITVSIAGNVSLKSGLLIADTSFWFLVSKVPEGALERLSSMNFDQSDYDPQEIRENNLGNPWGADVPEDCPELDITHYHNPAPGRLIMTSDKLGVHASYLRITDNHGIPVFYRKYNSVRDFKIIPGNRLVHYYAYNHIPATQCYMMLDNHYHVIDTLTMGNGYIVDHHECRVLENGNYFLQAYDPRLVDMDTVIGGGTHLATVVGYVFQELDADDNVIFQWRSWDHFQITDATHIDFTLGWIDYAHGNAIEVDNDENLLISCRHMNEITKIDRNSGNIIWRFGPKAINNMFEFTNDTMGFTFQHDIRRAPNGNLTLYDNGNHHYPPCSQALEYDVDEENLIATRVWNYINDPVVYGSATGSTIRLQDGNTFIGWGSIKPGNPFLCEVTPEGDKTLEIFYPKWLTSYRVRKGEWKNGMLMPDTTNIDFGNFSGTEVRKSVTISNNAGQEVEIGSVYHECSAFYVDHEIPFTIPAGGSESVDLIFSPGFHAGEIEDVFTFNYDSYFLDSLPQRIATQVHVSGTTPDTLPPQVHFSPCEGASDISVDTAIILEFSEPVFLPDGSIIQSADIQQMFRLYRDSIGGAEVQLVAHIDTWKRKVYLLPEQLETYRKYYIEVPAGQLADGSGMVMDKPCQSYFYTYDVLGPQITFYPEDGETNVFRDVTLQINFDEPVYNPAGGAADEIYLHSIVSFCADAVGGEPVAFNCLVDEDRMRVSVVPDELLEADREYFLMIPDSTLADDSNNLNPEQSVSFTTGEELGVHELSSGGLHCFPNPTNGRLSIKSDHRKIRQIEMFDTQGDLIISKPVKGKNGIIDLSPYRKGFYLLRVTLSGGKSAENEVTRKILKN